MSKYKELWIYIKNNAPKELTFDEVEKYAHFRLTTHFSLIKKNLQNTVIKSRKYL